MLTRKGVEYLPTYLPYHNMQHGSNKLYSTFSDGGWNLFVHSFTCSHIPGQRGESNFFGQMFSLIKLYVWIRDTNLYKTARGSFSYRQIVYRSLSFFVRHFHIVTVILWQFGTSCNFMRSCQWCQLPEVRHSCCLLFYTVCFVIIHIAYHFHHYHRPWKTHIYDEISSW